jgi:hypothetical protein
MSLKGTWETLVETQLGTYGGEAWKTEVKSLDFPLDIFFLND